MGYPTNLINEGEDVALDLRPHWWYFSKHILTGIPLFVLIVLVFGYMDDGTGKDVASVVVAILTIVWALWLLVKFLEWTRTYFVVTSQRVIWRTGLLARHGVEIPLDRVNNINFRQGIWERIIGAGTLDIQSAGEEGTSRFSYVRHPDGVQQEIYRQMESDAGSDAGRGAGAIGKAVADAMRDSGGRGADIPEQIEKLAKLRDQGHITAAEFEKKKADLLEKM